MQIFAPLTNEAQPSLQKVEIVSSLQIPSFYLIGLPSPEVAEARERVRAAVESSEFEFPRKRVVINLSPASIRKKGTGIDLAIALAILAHHEKLELKHDAVAWGELGLDGSVKAVGKPMRVLFAAWKSEVRRLLIPESDLAGFQSALELLSSSELLDPATAPLLLPVGDLREAWARLKEDSIPEQTPIRRTEEIAPLPRPQLLPLDPELEKILGIAAFGHHHLLLLGPKGTGKTHALDWFEALLPPPSIEAQILRRLVRELLDGESPSFVRRVGMHVRPAALIGSVTGGTLRPGEFSLAHGGLLIADELPEWARDSREAFREPLESGLVTLSRAQGNAELPARFLLAATGNLCGCGGWPPEIPFPLDRPRIKHRRCICSVTQRQHYLYRLSGPLLDRIDLAIVLHSGPVENAGDRIERHRILSEKVRRARRFSKEVLGETPGLLSPSRLESLLNENPRWKKLLSRQPCTNLRARHKNLRLALSFCLWEEADAGEPRYPLRLTEAHFLEAALYRPEGWLGEENGVAEAR